MDLSCASDADLSFLVPCISLRLRVGWVSIRSLRFSGGVAGGLGIDEDPILCLLIHWDHLYVVDLRPGLDPPSFAFSSVLSTVRSMVGSIQRRWTSPGDTTGTTHGFLPVSLLLSNRKTDPGEEL